MSFGFTYPYYRDPRDDERAIGALANRGRAPDGPSPDQVSSSLSALARMGLTPDETPPEPQPAASEASPDAGAFAALRRQLEAQTPPEPESLPEPAVDPEIEQAVVRSAHGALSNKNLQLQAAAQALEPKPVDPEIARAGLASSYGALAQNAPPPPVTRKPSPVPVGLQDRVPTQEFNLAPPEPQSQAEYDSEHPKASVGGLPQQDDDAGPPGVNQWALAADLMMNGGRGVQQIVGMANQQRQAWEQSRRSKIEDAYKQQQYELGKAGIEARNREADFRERQAEIELDRLQHPEKYIDPEKKGERETREWHLKDESERAWEGQRLADERARAADAERRADNARAERGMTESERHNRAVEAQYGAEKPLTPAQKLQREKVDALRTPIPSTKVEDEDAWNAAMVSPTARDKLEKTVSMYNVASKAIDRMIELRNLHGVEVTSSPAKSEYSMLQKQVAGAYSEIGKTGVLSKEEFLRYANEMPGIGYDDDVVGNSARSVAGVFGKNYDPTLNKLNGVREATASAIRDGLTSYGISYTGNTKHAPKETTPQPDSTKTDGVTTHEPADRLPNTGNTPSTSITEPEHDTEEYWRSVANKPSTVTLTSPDGKETKSFQLDSSGFDKEFDQKVRAGWKNTESSLGDTGERRRDVAKPGDAPPDPIGKWTKRGRIVTPKVDEDPLKKYRDMGLLVD